MNKMKDIDQIMDELIINCNSVFKQLLSAIAMKEITMNEIGIDQAYEGISISVKVGVDLQIEPIPIIEVKQFTNEYLSFLLDASHGKLARLWIDSLNDIFSLFIDLHFTGKRKFKEYKKQIKLPFQSFDTTKDIDDQIKDAVIKDFNFQSHNDKLWLINKVLNLTLEKEKEFENIKKNIFIRNSIEHGKGFIRDYVSKELGDNKIVILDATGMRKIFNINDKIILSIPEIYEFKCSVIFISQLWRKKYGKLFNGNHKKT